MQPSVDGQTKGPRLLKHKVKYQGNLVLQALSTTPGHGKLLVDGPLYPSAYATNVNEQVRPGWPLAGCSEGGHPSCCC